MHLDRDYDNSIVRALCAELGLDDLIVAKAVRVNPHAFSSYLGIQHPVCRPFRFEPSTARNLGIRRGAPAIRPKTHPQIQQEGPKLSDQQVREDRPRTPGRGRMAPGMEAHAQPSATGVTDRLSAESVRLRILS